MNLGSGDLIGCSLPAGAAEVQSREAASDDRLADLEALVLAKDAVRPPGRKFGACALRIYTHISISMFR